MKLLVKILILSVLCLLSNIVIAGEMINSYGNMINLSEYPVSSEVEPIVNEISDLATLEAGVENTINVSLDDCIRLALGNNPRIQSAMQDVFAADTRIKQVWSNYFPEFSWQSGYSRIRQLQLSDVFRENLIYNYWVLGQISGTQLLYDFGVTQNQATIRKLDFLGYKIILTGTVNDVVYLVKDAYYNLLYLLEAKKISEDNVKEYEKFYNQAKGFYAAGMKPKVDVTIAEVSLSNAKLTQIQANHNVYIAMAKLNNVIGIPYYMQYRTIDKLKFVPCDIKLNKAIELCEKSRPEFELAQVRVEQSLQNYKLIKKSWLPQFITQGQFEVGGRHPDSNYGYTFGAYLNFPAINGMELKYRLREASILYAKEQSNETNSRNNVYYEVQNAYYTLDEKKNKLPVAYLGMKQAKQNFELSSGRYKVGVGDPVELNDAQVQYKNAQLVYYQTLYELNSARAKLEKTIGRNLSDEEVLLQ